jgi:hypothetical protein
MSIYRIVTSSGCTLETTMSWLLQCSIGLPARPLDVCAIRNCPAAARLFFG